MSSELDFSMLDNIKPESAIENEPNLGKIYYKLEAEENRKARLDEAAAKQREVYSEHQNAIIKAGQLTSEITKGIQAGEKLEILLLKAVECIGLMTGDSVSCEINKTNIKKTYGVSDDTEMGMLDIRELDDFLHDK